ncbi:uncharacterized protein LOC143852990 isoform X2 [Tasmannia lanceolata]
MSEKLGKHGVDSDQHMRKDCEFVRPVIPNEQSFNEVAILQPKPKGLKALFICLVLMASLLIFLNWGGFDLEKVFLLIMQWEATACGRSVLAFVLVASLAFLEVVSIPPEGSMWLAGMIFGYVGFVITMIGTTIGMSLFFLIGASFRAHGGHKAAVVRLDRQGSWFHQFREVALIRVTHFDTLFNRVMFITDMNFGPYICGFIAGTVPGAFIFTYSGRLMRTMVDTKYNNHQVTTVEAVFNIIILFFSVVFSFNRLWGMIRFVKWMVQSRRTGVGYDGGPERGRMMVGLVFLKA